MAARTLIIVPAYNEEAALPGVLAELAQVVPEHDVLVVDDGSADRTSAVARSAGVVVATMPFNLGVGGALRTGFRYALRHGYDRAIQLDADGQHDPSLVKTLLDALDEGADLVIGSRFADPQQGVYEVGRTRGGAMRLLRLIVRALSGQRLTDTSSGFRAFNRPTLQLFAHHYPVEYLGDTVEALLLASYAGLSIVEVPTPMRTRAAGVPSNRSFRLVYHYLRLLVTVAITLPIRRAPRLQEPRA
jgi:glycosyltransferase involved in cell wall biosynthesis